MHNPVISFRRLATITSVLFFALAIIWMFFPEKALTSWGVHYTDSAGLVSRRAAAMYAGLCVMLWVARNAAPSPARRALSAGLVIACIFIASDGVYDFLAGNAGSGILKAVLIEAVLAILFTRYAIGNIAGEKLSSAEL